MTGMDEQVYERSTTGASSSASQMFRVDRFLNKVSRGLGHVVALAACSPSFWVATSKNFLIRYDESSGKVQERKLDCVTVKKLFALDHDHLLATVHDGKNLETLCVRTDTMVKDRPSVVKGLQGRYLTSAVMCGTHTVMGSDTGMLFSSESPMGPFTKLMEIPQRHKRRSPVSGLVSIEHDGELVLLALCGTCLHCFSLPNPGAWFDEGVQVRPVELPIEQDAAQLQVVEEAGSSHGEGKRRVAVLSTSGVFFGDFPGLGQLQSEPIPFSCGPGEALPMCMALMRYHVALLFPTKVQFVNMVSRQVVLEVPVQGTILGLNRDIAEGRLFLLTGDDVHEIDYSDEDRDMWRVYVAEGMYTEALPLCRTAEQRNAVYLGQAEALFEEGRFEESARLFGKLTSPSPSFDEVVSRFLALDGTDGMGGRGPSSLSKGPMRAFLESKLSTLGPRNVVERTMISTWLLELLVDKAAQDEQDSVAQDLAGKERRMPGGQISRFLAKHVDCLHPRTTVSILKAYGRTDDLLSYARAREDTDAEVELLMSAGKSVEAIRVLRKPSSSVELVYKYATDMLKCAPRDAISLWMDRCSGEVFADGHDLQSGEKTRTRSNNTKDLDPRRLVPAIAPYGHVSACAGIRSEIIRFVNFAIDLCSAVTAEEVDRREHRPKNGMGALYDINMSLLSADADNEGLLVEKIAAHRTLYDPLQALRLCSERGRRRAVTALLVELELWNEAVTTALEVGDHEHATRIARQCGDGDLRKRLFLDIIRNLLETDPNCDGDAISSIVEEAECVSMDEILMVLPDDVRIGAFGALLSSGVQALATKMGERKLELKMADTALRGIASHLRSMSLPAKPTDVSKCASCNRFVLTEPPPASAGPCGGLLTPYFVFPSGNQYHGSCLCYELTCIMDYNEAIEIRKLSKVLASRPPGSRRPGDLEMKRALDAELSAEDPLCGERLVSLIRKPFLEFGDGDGSYLSV